MLIHGEEPRYKDIEVFKSVEVPCENDFLSTYRMHENISCSFAMKQEERDKSR